MNRERDPSEGKATVDQGVLPYDAFARRYFGPIYRWCEGNVGDDPERLAIAAQRILLDLYRLERGGRLDGSPSLGKEGAGGGGVATAA